MFQEKLEGQEKKIAEQQSMILSFIQKEKESNEEKEKRNVEEKERVAKEQMESQAKLKQDMTEVFDAKVFSIIKMGGVLIIPINIYYSSLL